MSALFGIQRSGCCDEDFSQFLEIQPLQTHRRTDVRVKKAFFPVTKRVSRLCVLISV